MQTEASINNEEYIFRDGPRIRFANSYAGPTAIIQRVDSDNLAVSIPVAISIGLKITLGYAFTKTTLSRAAEECQGTRRELTVFSAYTQPSH